MSEIAAPSRIPKIKVAKGIHAVIGIGRSHWTTGSKRSATNSFQPIRIPSVTPITAAIANPIMTREVLRYTYSNQVPEYQANAVRCPNIHCHSASSTVLGAGRNVGSYKFSDAETCQRASNATGTKKRRRLRFHPNFPGLRRTGKRRRFDWAGDTSPVIASPCATRDFLLAEC